MGRRQADDPEAGASPGRLSSQPKATDTALVFTAMEVSREDHVGEPDPAKAQAAALEDIGPMRGCKYPANTPSGNTGNSPILDVTR